MSRCYALVIDDSDTMRHLLKFALRRLPNFDMLQATNGAEGLRALSEHEVTVILLDINMPVMNGLVFLEALAASPHKDIPVIVVTTEGEQEDIDRALALGAKAHVTKPVQAATLADTIARVLQENQPGR